jgi:hypothetical protein
MRILSMVCLVLLGWTDAAWALTYRGRSIEVGPTPEASACVELVRKGIDLVETLPADLRKLGGMITDLRCDPAPPKATNTSAYDNTTGVYVWESKTEPKGHIVFRRGPNFQAPSDVALSLVGNGVYARQHRDWIDARQKAAAGDAAAKARLAYWDSVFTKSDRKAAVKADCENMDAAYQTMKALGADSRKLSGMASLALRHGCP